MKKCPYCAEEIQDSAIKCKHCGEWLEEDVQEPPPQVVEVKKIEPLKAQPQGEVVSPESDEEIKRKKEAGLKQCPICGKWDAYRAVEGAEKEEFEKEPIEPPKEKWRWSLKTKKYGETKEIVEDGQQEDWCPHCKKPIGWCKQIYYPITNLDAANKSIAMAYITAIFVTIVTGAYQLYYIGVFVGLVDIIISSVISFGIYKKSRICATIMFVGVLIRNVEKLTNGVMMQVEGQKSLAIHPVAIIVMFSISLIIYQGMRGTFAYHRMIRETEQTKG